MKHDIHTRTCWECGNIAEHTDRVIPAVTCKKCGSNDTRPARPEVKRFNAESWVCVHTLANSETVNVASNIADERVAEMYAKGVRSNGGHVFRICKTGVLIAALELIKTPKKDCES